ncbi:MAG TPA: heavy metal translocating P-type ATPase [Bacillales bacterium]|nr:heavy metal translocating P-type ATPase [Bacillales bacterium]
MGSTEKRLSEQLPLFPLRVNHTWLAFLQKHGEMIAALSAGVLILCGWALTSVHDQTAAIAVFVAAFVIGGFAKAKEGIEETVKEKDLNVELLMFLAAIGAAIIGYWLEGAVLIFIFSLSGALETYTMNKSRRELSSLLSLKPETARLLENGREETVMADQLAVDDVILVKPGERMPADGVIIRGRTSVNEAAITGESMPVEKTEASEVLAGTMNLDGAVQVKVTKTSEESLFQKIITLVQNAETEKPPSHLFIEKLESTYVKSVLAASALMMVLPHFAFGWSWHETVYRALVLLVVASPCALVASTMPAVLSAISCGARQGMLFKGGVHLEGLGKIGAIAFDKTGTLTKGEPEVTDVRPADGWSAEQLLQVAASIESYANHPLAAAITAQAKKQKVPLVKAEDVKDTPGWGIEATVDGTRYAIGKAGFVDDEKAKRFMSEQGVKGAGKTFVFVKEAGNGIVGMLALKDSVRTEVKEAIRRINEAGIETVMLTGDEEETAREIAREAGVRQYRAGCLPDEKLAEIKRLTKKYHRAAMVGDGINDTPALAAADIGIAMGAGTDAALETADVVIVKNDLLQIANSIRLSKRMNRIIKQNIVFAVAVILLLITSNLFENLSLPLGVIGHEGSTILVILNGLRLLRG